MESNTLLYLGLLFLITVLFSSDIFHNTGGHDDMQSRTSQIWGPYPIFLKSNKNTLKKIYCTYLSYYIKFGFSKLVINMIVTYGNYIFKIVTCVKLKNIYN